MKKVIKKLKQSLSILLAVAMVVTCVPQTATLAFAASDTELTDTIDAETSTDAETETDISDDTEMPEDESGLVSEDEEEVPADETEQPDMADEEATGEDAEVELMEGGLEIQEGPTLNLDKATNDSHAITFEVDNEQVEVTENDAAFVETDEATAYTFKATAKIGHKITSIKAYKTSDKEAEPEEGKGPWEGKTPVAIWTESEDDSDTITYTDGTYSIPKEKLETGSDDGAAVEAFTIVIESEKEKYDVTVTLSDTNANNITSMKYSVDGAEAKDLTSGTLIQVPYQGTLKIKLVPAANRTVTVKRDDTVVEAGAAEDGDTEGTLTYTFENITGATAITVSTVKTNPDKYDVVEDIKPGEGAASTNVKIEYTDECVVDGKIAEDTDLTFKVTPDAGYSVVVTYKIGADGQESNAMKADENGVYTITKENITFAENATDKKVTIIVAVTKIEYTITFNKDDANGAEIKIVKGETSAEPATDGEKVNFGDKVTFTVNPGKQTVDGKEVANKLRYVSTTQSADNAMTAISEKDGVYTYEYTVGTDTAESTTIYVSATPKENVDLTLNVKDGKSDKVTIKQVTGEGTTDSPYVLGEAVSDGKITAEEDSQVLFVVEPSEGSVYKVASVSFEENALETKEITVGADTNAATYTAYVITVPEKTGTIDIELELDDTKANIANFALKDSKVGKNAFKVEIDGAEGTYHAEDRFLTEANSISFTVKEGSGYEIGDIVATWTVKATEEGKEDEVKEEKLTQEDGKYTLTFGADKRDVTITVDASVSAMKGNATVGFNKVSSGIHSYEVSGDEKVSHLSGNIYKLSEGAQLVEFTVYALENYTPAVSYKDVIEGEDGDIVEVTAPKPGEGEEKGTGKAKVTVYPYVYSIPAVVLGNNNTITIDAKAVTKNINVYYSRDEVEVSVKLNGDILEDFEYIKDTEDANKIIGRKFAVAVDTDAVLVIEPKENCVVDKVMRRTGGTEVNETKNVKAGELKLAKGNVDTDVTITTKANYAVVVKSVNGDVVGSELEAVKGAYTVDYTGQYQITALKGTKDSPISDAEVIQTKVTDAAEKAQIAVLSEDKNSVKLNLSAKDANQTVKVRLTFGEGESVETKVLEFKVLAQISKLTIKGITLDNAGKGTLLQDADTKKEYQITLTPKTANMDKLGVEILAAKDGATPEENAAAQALLDAEIKNGNLEVTTKPQKDKENATELDKAVIRVLDKNLKDGEAGYVKAEITVSITAPKALKDATPVVSVKSATDTTITLSLGLGKVNVENPVEGQLWYQVTVEADANKTDDSKLTEEEYNLISNAVGTFYIEKTAAAQDATLKVSNADLGQGREWGYKLKVQLIQLDSKVSLENNDSRIANALMLSKVNAKAADAAITAAGNAKAFVSNTTAEIAANTRTPYYETKLKVKKGKTTVYTGQQDVPIATLQFGNDTTYKMARAEDISVYPYNNINLANGEPLFEGGEPGSGMVNLYVKDGTVYMSVDGSYEDYYYGEPRKIYNAPITGSHTIRIYAVEPGNTYPVTADIKVTVVRGINNVSVQPASSVVYKPEGKAATLKVTPVYNGDSTGKDKTAQPKTKKLTYELVGNTDPNVKINPNNGTVTIDKKYVLSKESNSFTIKATAKDFEGNETEGYGWFEISNKALEISRVELLRSVTVQNEDYDYVTTYNVVAANGTNVYSDELTRGNVRAYAFKSGAPEKVSYTEDEIGEYTLWGNEVSYKSSNNAVQINTYGYITGVTKVADNVKITATANDGGKKSAVMTFNVKYAEPYALGLLVEQQADDGSYYHIFNAGATAATSGQYPDKINVIGTADTVLRLSLMQREENGVYSRAYQYTNVKMTVKGGKVLQKADAYNRNMVIIANKDTIEVTLENKALKPSAKVTYVIKNNAAGIKTGLQKVTTTTKALTEYSVNDQVIKYQLNVKDKEKYEYEKDEDQLYVMVQPDAADKSKKYWQYNDLESHSGIKGVYPVGKDGSFNIWFEGARSFTPGTYKLQMTFGKVSNDRDDDTYGSFIAEYKPQTVSVKINAMNTKVSFKPATTLTMSLKDKASVVLTGNGKNYDYVSFYQLQNINGYGTSNTEECFRTYFSLVNEEVEGKYVQVIKLKDDLTPDQIAFITGSDKKAQNARTAYISYSAVNYNPRIANAYGTAKITVKFATDKKDGIYKSTASYSAASTVIIEGNKATSVSITAAKKPATVLYAIVSDAGETGFKIDPRKMSIGEDTFTISTSNTLAVNKKGYPVKVKVIPEGAHSSTLTDIKEKRDAYVAALQGSDEAAKTAAEDAYKNAILNSKAAIELTTNVKVVAKGEKVNKIAIAASELKKASWNYNEVEKYYWSRVYYTMVSLESDVYDVTATFKPADTTIYGNVVSFGNPEFDDDGRLYFDIRVSKAELANAETAVQNKNAKKHAYGTTIDVTANVSYGKIVTEDGVTKLDKDIEVTEDKFTFKVTLPNKLETSNFAATLAAVKADAESGALQEKIYAGKDYPEFPRVCKGYPFGGMSYDNESDWVLEGPSDPDYWDYWYDNMVEAGNQKEAELYGYINGALWQVHDAVYAMAPEASETDIVMEQHSEYEEKITLKPSEFVAPTSTKAGKLVIRVQLTDNSIYEYDETNERVIKADCKDENGNIKGEYRETVSIVLNIPRAGEEPNDIVGILKKYVDDTKANKTFAKLPQVQYYNVLSDVIKPDGDVANALSEYPTLRFNIEYPYEIWTFDWETGYNRVLYAQPEDWVRNWALNNGYDGYDPSYDELPEEYKFDTYTDADGNEHYITDWKSEASEEAAGYIAGILHVWGIKYGGEEVRVPFVFTIDKLESMADIKSNIEWALGNKTTIAGASEEDLKKVKLTPSNKTTKEQVEAIFKAAYANPSVTASWGELTGLPEGAEEKSFVLKDATVPTTGENATDGKGSIRCAIKLSKEGAEDVTFEVEIEIPALATADEAVNAVKAVVMADSEGNAQKVKDIVIPIVEKHLKTITTGDELPAELKTTIVNEVKGAILTAANKAVEGQPYTVVYSQTGEEGSKEDVFKFEPYTFKNDGEISYALEVKALTKGVNGDTDVVVGATVDGGTLTLAKVVLSKDPSLVTWSQAAAVITEALKNMTGVSNATTSDEVLEAAGDAITDLDADGSTTGITVSHKQTEDGDYECTFTPATFTAKGSLNGTLVLTRELPAEDDTDPDAEAKTETSDVEYTVELPELTKKDQAAATTEVTRALKAVGVVNEDAELTAEGATTFKLTGAKEEALVAEAVKVLADSGYTAKLDTAADKVSTVTKATVNIAGTATINLVLEATEVAEGETAATVTDEGKFNVDFTIRALSQSITQLENAINAVLAEKYKDGKVTLPTGTTDLEEYATTLKTEIDSLLTTPDVVIKHQNWVVEWAEDSGLEAVKEDDATVTGYKGTLNIFRAKDGNKVGNPLKTVEVTLTIATATETPETGE